MRNQLSTVHVIDDDDAVRESLEALLLVAGFDVHTYASAEEFLARSPDDGCLVLDVNMPGLSGLELLERLAADGRSYPVVLLTARRDDGLRDLAVSLGASEFLNKPVTEGDLMRAIADAGSHRAACAGNTGIPV